MTDWLGETVTSDVGWSHLEDLVAIGSRGAGTEGERAAAEATRDAFDTHARVSRIDEFDVTGWRRDGSSVRGPGGEVDCIALPRSPDAVAEGPLVDLGHGLPRDFERADVTDAVVLVDTDTPSWYDREVHRREKYYRAVEGGAAAFVFQNHVPGCLPRTGSVGTPDEPVGPVPAVAVSRETGARLIRRHEGQAVEVAVDAETGPATSRNVHAELGPATDTELLVTSHLDAHDVTEGAMDNGAGTALAVELARALADREADLATRVRFVAFGAEEVGLRGSTHEAERVDRDGVRAVVNLDGVLQARNLAVVTHGFEPIERAVRAVADRLGHPVTVDPHMGPHSDHWPFVRRGVPGCQVHADTEHGGRGWGHTAADTLDKLDVRDLRENAVFLTHLLVDLAGSSFAVAHVDEADVAAALESQGLAEPMRVTGDWPY